MVALGLGAALGAGITTDEFWRLTPHLTWLALRSRRREALAQAWHIAALGRVKKLPALADLTGDRKAPQGEPITDASVIAQMARLRRATRPEA